MNAMDEYKRVCAVVRGKEYWAFERSEVADAADAVIASLEAELSVKGEEYGELAARGKRIAERLRTALVAIRSTTPRSACVMCDHMDGVDDANWCDTMGEWEESVGWYDPCHFKPSLWTLSRWVHKS